MIIKSISLHVEVYTPNDKEWLTVVFLTPEGREHKINIYNDVVIQCFMHNPKAVIDNFKKHKDDWEEVYVRFPKEVFCGKMSYAGCYVMCKTCIDPHTGEKRYVVGWDPQTRMMVTLKSFNHGI